MTIVELALIHIRHFKETKKFLLKPGFNLILGGNGSGKTTLFNVFKDVFFPSYEGYDPEGSSQAALSFKLDTGEVYRILRNFSKQSVQFYKLDPSANKFVLVEKEDPKIQKLVFSFLKQESLSKEQIISIFFLSRSSLPSLSPKIKSAISFPSPASSERKTGDLSKIKTSLEELKKQEAKADLLAQKESEMLDQKDKIFSIKRTLTELESIDSELSGISEKEKSFPGFAAVPREIGQIIEDYEKAILEKNNEEQQYIEEKEIIEQQLSLEQQNLLQNKFLWAGGAIVLFALFLPFFIDVEGVLKQIDLVALILGIGLALFSLIKDFNKISQRKVWNIKLDNKNKNIEMLNARFQREHSKYFEVLQKTGSSSREEFETKFSAYRHLKEEESALILKKQNIVNNKPKETLLAELIEASEKAEAAEREINQLKPGTRDPYIIQQEIKSLEDSLSSENASASLSTLSINPEEGLSSPPVETSKSLFTLLENEWPLILRESGLNLEQLNEMIQKKISIVTGNTVTIRFDEKGVVSLNRDLNALSPGTIDQIFWSLFIFRLERLRNVSFPLLLDDPLITLDPARQSLILNSLNELSKTRQIVLLSSTPYPVEAAHLIKL